MALHDPKGDLKLAALTAEVSMLAIEVAATAIYCLDPSRHGVMLRADGREDRLKI